MVFVLFFPWDTSEPSESKRISDQDETLSQYLEVVAVCDQIIEQYSNDNGLVDISNQQFVLEAIFDAVGALKTDGVIEDCFYESGDTGVLVELASGIQCFCSPTIDGYLSGSDEAKIVTVSPYQDLVNDRGPLKTLFRRSGVSFAATFRPENTKRHPVFPVFL